MRRYLVGVFCRLMYRYAPNKSESASEWKWHCHHAGKIIETGGNMEERIYDYWVATLQDGYIGNIIDMVKNAGGARAMFEMSEKEMTERLGIPGRLAQYIDERKTDIGLIEEDYYRLQLKKISYVNHADQDFPERLRNIPSRPYGIFVKGSLPDTNVPSVAIVGARECSEYGRLMAEYFGDRLAKRRGAGDQRNGVGNRRYITDGSLKCRRKIICRTRMWG